MQGRWVLRAWLQRHEQIQENESHRQELQKFFCRSASQSSTPDFAPEEDTFVGGLVFIISIIAIVSYWTRTMNI